LSRKQEFPLPVMPWVGPGSSITQAAYWYELTDFVQFPHVTYFSSLPDKLDKLRELDAHTIRNGMRKFNEATFRDSVVFYRKAALELLS